MTCRKDDLRSLAEGTLQAGRVVLVHGLEQQPELNGLCGQIVQWHKQKGRYGVQLQEKAVLLRPASLHLPLPPGRQVLLSDLPEEWKQFNGMDGRIAKFLPETCRYQVELPKRFKSSNIPSSINVEPCNVVDDNVKYKSFTRRVNAQLTEDDMVAMMEEMSQRTEPTGYDDLRKLIPGMRDQPRSMYSGFSQHDLLELWQARMKMDAELLAYKDVPPGLLREMDAGLAELVQRMTTFTPQDAEQANACIDEDLSKCFNRACDLNDQGRTDKAMGPAKKFVDAYEAAPFVASLVEFEIRHLPHPDDNVAGCSHMASTMYNLCGNDPESSLALRYKRMLYSFHLRMHMYCRAVGPERLIWLRRLTETAGSLSVLLQEQGRVDDAVFCFKVSSGWTWASGKSDNAAKQILLTGTGGGRDVGAQVATFAMRDGKVVRGVSATQLKAALKACSTCKAIEPHPDVFQNCPCHTVAYCSSACQKEHWKVHKKTCAARGTGKTSKVGH